MPMLTVIRIVGESETQFKVALMGSVRVSSAIKKFSLKQTAQQYHAH